MNPAHEIRAAFGSALEQVGNLDSRYLAAALGLQLLTLVFKATAWRNVLGAAYPGTPVSRIGIGCSYVAGVALNAFLPARGGEAVKVALARSQVERSTVPTIAGTLGVLSLLDGLLGVALMGSLWGLGVLPELPRLPGGDKLFALLAAVPLAVAALIGLRRLAPGRMESLARRVAQGFAVLRSPGRYLRAVLPYQLAAWACRIGVVFLLLAAFRIEAGLETAALLVVVGGLSTVVPVPGGAGAQQLLAAYALNGIVGAAGAVSFSLGMQVGITAVNTTIGVLGAMVLMRTFRPVIAVRLLHRRHRS